MDIEDIFGKAENWINDRVDDAAKVVQKFTGEKERRQIVEETKHEYKESRNAIQILIDILNNLIKVFNQKIKALNSIREEKVKINIQKLGSSLSIFGNIKDMSEYSEEKEKLFFYIPERAFEKVENYIADIDWSSDEIFLRTFFQGIFTPFFTRKQNKKMIERL